MKRPATPLPKKCTGDDPLVDVINRIIDCLKERTPIEGTAIKIRYGKDGYEVQSEGGSSEGDFEPVWRP